jgi:hypothetical protein
MPGTANRLLDRIPLTGFFTADSTSAYRSCGTAGFYLALATSFGAALITGRSLLVVAVLAFVCAASFFGYTLLRKAVGGQECLVLIEHVWVALASSAGALWLLQEPVAAYMDVITPGLCFFLACGRMGCLFVGCCHGIPSPVGIEYGETHVAHGFPREFSGVRLFPVQLVEMIGLTMIGIAGFAALPFARTGTVMAWYLLAYSILRFATEGTRGDHRPHWLGLSQPRWMSIAEVLFVLGLWSRPAASGRLRIALAIMVLSLVIVVCGLAVEGRRLFRDRHLCELRSVLDWSRLGAEPRILETELGVRVAASAVGGWDPENAHVSFSFSRDSDGEVKEHLRLLCQTAARAFPHLLVNDVHYRDCVLHFVVPLLAKQGRADLGAADRSKILYTRALRSIDKPALTAQEDARARPNAAARAPHQWFFRQ